MAQLKTTLLVSAAILLLTTFAASNASSLLQDGLHVPCTYIDTVNVTGYQKFLNGSYLYEGTIIPANLIGIYDYEYKADASFERVPVKPHVRGCVCKLKPCLKFCCPLDQQYNGTNCEAHVSNYSPVMNITTKQGDLVEENVFQKFAVQIGQPCRQMYHLLPHINEYDAFSLFENGTLYRLDDLKYLTKEEYCLASTLGLDNYTEIIVPINCFQPITGGTKSLVYACMMLFSVPFMILTIIVYIGIPELRTLHGKSLCCYLLGLCFGYCILSAFNLVSLDRVSQFNCAFWGFVAYFSFMASFFWVSVISFDLFYNIRAPRGRFNEKKRFIMYSIYAWGLAFIFLALTYYAQNSSLVPNHLKPAIGSDEFCWLNVKNGWSAVIYFYAPIIVIIGFNLTMFVLTALQINGVQKEMSRMMERNDSQKNLRTEKDRFGIFLRLFIVMGVTWSMEIISYFFGANSSWDKLFYITDICNGIQGFLIFTLFVLKKKVKQYITNRYQSTSRPERQSQYSNKTTSSSINLPMNGVGADKPLMDKFVKIQNQ